jgi:prolyl-tRNA editing enzyme YbaK/EbsC (Cys-tRNA(Pro) deacylase)
MKIFQTMRRASYAACLISSGFDFASIHTLAMSLQSVKDFFSSRHIEIEIIELPVSTATVALAAEAHGVEPGQIAKTLAFKLNDGRVVLVVAKGDARIDNKKFKDAFGKGKMLGLEEVADITGHPVGGVCPFGLASPLPVYLDVSLRTYNEVIPAAGSVNSAVRISPEKMADITQAEWVNVCQSL